ncbi:hypothetical protein Taro_056192 [Colocasia esculenta]|uniref:Uncharacterized protein n=1 Tax=Colocasia esculenta TaxID=4460 RepID=A0A843XT88_COLES|nr:hypothetical protein [Colocasia esculenta]
MKKLFWEEGPVSTCPESVSTCCPNSSNWLFWELGLVSTCSMSVSTWGTLKRNKLLASCKVEELMDCDIPVQDLGV